jgi:hypothetical protein
LETNEKFRVVAEERDRRIECCALGVLNGLCGHFARLQQDNHDRESSGGEDKVGESKADQDLFRQRQAFAEAPRAAENRR